MTDLLYDYITMGVDMLISAVILASVVVLLRSSTILSSYAANQQATSDRINYYREYSAYDCTTGLASSDVISAMVYYRYDLDVVIWIGEVAYWNDKDTGYYYKGNEKIPYETLASAVSAHTTWSAYVAEDFGYDHSSGKTVSALSTSGYQGGLITGLYFYY